jgi:hypothetical protein
MAASERLEESPRELRSEWIPRDQRNGHLTGLQSPQIRDRYSDRVVLSARG